MSKEVPHTLEPQRSWRGTSPCRMCNGHTDDDGRYYPGLVVLPRCLDSGRWILDACACDDPSCAWGAEWIRNHPRAMPRSKHTNALPGLTAADLTWLCMFLEKGKTLADAADKITQPDRRSRVLSAIEREIPSDAELWYERIDR